MNRYRWLPMKNLITFVQRKQRVGENSCGSCTERYRSDARSRYSRPNWSHIDCTKELADGSLYGYWHLKTLHFRSYIRLRLRILGYFEAYLTYEGNE